MIWAEHAAEDVKPPVALVLADFMFAARIASGLSQMEWGSRIAASPEAVKASLQTELPDLVIVELGNAPAPRIALIREIKADPSFRALPLLAFGSHKAKSVLHEARDAGASLVVSNGTLVSRFAEMVETARQAGPATVERLITEDEDD